MSFFHIHYFTIADIFHLLAYLILVKNVNKSKSTLGISISTQYLYLLAFIARFLPFLVQLMIYHVIVFLVDVALISLSAYLTYKLRKDKKIHQSAIDGYRSETPVIWKSIIAISLVSTIITIYFTDWDILDVGYIFSSWVEGLSLLPQIIIVFKTNIVICFLEYLFQIEPFSFSYLFFLAAYYIINIIGWIIDFGAGKEFFIPTLVAEITHASLFIIFISFIYVSSIENKNRYRTVPVVN